MDICLTWIILGLITLGLMFYLMMTGWERAMDNVFDGLAKGDPREAWYEHVRDGGSMSLEEYRAWFEQKDEFDQMDKLDQLISELDTPIKYHEPLIGMEADRRRMEVIDELVKIGDKKAIEAIIKTAENPEFPSRMGAIYALGEIDDKRAIDSLVKTLNDKDKDMRDCAVETLDKLGWEPEND